MEEKKTMEFRIPPGLTPDTARGVVIVTHGINFRPSRMSEIEDIFLGHGYAVMRMVLKGHEEDTGEALWPDVSSTLWIEEMRHARAEAARLAAGRPIYACGFSLGALVTLAEYTQALAEAGTAGTPGAEAAGAEANAPFLTEAGMTEAPGAEASAPFLAYAGLLLIAPAVFLRPRANLVRLLFRWPRIRLWSLAGKYYEVRPHTSVNAYHALFDTRRALFRAFKQRDWLRRASQNLPVLIIYDRFDVLTSGKRLFRKLKKHAPFCPQLCRVKAENLWHHLIIDRHALGDAGWENLTSAIGAFLARGTSESPE
jgi:alpha-beta hydrolase superfamily lysophospholipase